MNVLLISTYELGHQPFGMGSPTAWLKQAGATVSCVDLALDELDESKVASAGFIGVYVPMHTATRLATPLLPRLKRLNPTAHLCVFGLYAPMNEGFLRGLGADSVLGGEFEAELVALYRRLRAGGGAAPGPRESVFLPRLEFLVPDRTDLPPLQRYAHLVAGPGDHRVVGYTEATRGCKHLCRHCPIPPVYGGRFRVVQQEVVLADVARQVAAGAQHVTFGDPDFFNGPTHALKIVTALHERFPSLTYDVTIKIEHLLRHAAHLEVLRDTGCLFVTSAVESADDRVLELFDKHHTRADFVRVAGLFRDLGMVLNPTFVTFTPWTSRRDYLELLELIAELGLVGNVAPIQYAIRLLIPAGSRLLELPTVPTLLGDFDEGALSYSWTHPDEGVDRLYADVRAVVLDGQAREQTRGEIFCRVWDVARAANGETGHRGTRWIEAAAGPGRSPVAHLSEPWFC
jgi:radical SAM superfamily enzyme YgiQ (UPF0313 family)